MTAYAPEVSPVDQSAAEDELVHLVCCCDTNTAMCSWDVTEDAWMPVVAENTCVVCNDIWPAGEPCPRCGCSRCLNDKS